jgi:hypothetical protein|tara:strand:- start:5698 stop:5904 length:207 start_codon:yes stop_codon:yes gene_type:complete
MAEDQLSSGNPDGTNMGQSTSDKIGFYGVTNIVQAAVAATTTTTATTGALQTDIDAIRTALQNLGLIG